MDRDARKALQQTEKEERRELGQPRRACRNFPMGHCLSKIARLVSGRRLRSASILPMMSELLLRPFISPALLAQRRMRHLNHV
ncbi:hypothetical protein AU476_18390 [Cupriavidus sp. UYMSc13B]|nr:hypothetical protein AU476_18390 [Cupriavidus sp. UYMSc13B]